ncbi:hypothetical protein C8R44DRAFT_730098 [Mycena epipterygia]|nr:hypothetical protein C8R44DRAFT_730098 [Mycena epipterygia]
MTGFWVIASCATCTTSPTIAKGRRVGIYMSMLTPMSTFRRRRRCLHSGADADVYIQAPTPTFARAAASLFLFLFLLPVVLDTCACSPLGRVSTTPPFNSTMQPKQNTSFNHSTKYWFAPRKQKRSTPPELFRFGAGAVAHQPQVRVITARVMMVIPFAFKTSTYLGRRGDATAKNNINLRHRNLGTAPSMDAWRV